MEQIKRFKQRWHAFERGDAADEQDPQRTLGSEGVGIAAFERLALYRLEWQADDLDLAWIDAGVDEHVARPV